MNKKEIQQIMAIVRPAIIALYGRQPLRLDTYNIMWVDRQFITNADIWLQARNSRTKLPYTVHLEKGRVTYLKQRLMND